MEKITAAASSPQVLRRANARRVLEYAWRTGPFTASEAMEASGLTRSTVIGVCDDLVQQGWLDELGDARAAGAAGAYTKGRPARRYALRARAAVVVGVDAGDERITATVADLRGHVLGSATVEIPAKSPHRVERRADAEARRRLTRSTVHDALASCDSAATPVLAMTIGVPAPVDADGTSPADDWFWALMNPGYAQLLGDEAAIVTVENDANLVAIAEQRSPLGSGRTVDSYVAMLAGEGIGCGLMIDRRLVRGRRGAAGEMRWLDHVEGVGSADGFALLARQWAVDAFREGLPSGSALGELDPRTLGEADVALAAAAGDPVAGGIIERLAERLARICLLLGGLLDVDRVIMAGTAVASMPAIVDRAAAMLDASDDPTAPELVASALGRGAVSQGAIEHALDLVRDRALDLVPAAREAA